VIKEKGRKRRKEGSNITDTPGVQLVAGLQRTKEKNAYAQKDMMVQMVAD
jgi:hypothetical protein